MWTLASFKLWWLSSFLKGEIKTLTRRHLQLIRNKNNTFFFFVLWHFKNGWLHLILPNCRKLSSLSIIDTPACKSDYINTERNVDEICLELEQNLSLLPHWQRFTSQAPFSLSPFPRYQIPLMPPCLRQKRSRKTQTRAGIIMNKIVCACVCEWLGAGCATTSPPQIVQPDFTARPFNGCSLLLYVSSAAQGGRWEGSCLWRSGEGLCLL